MRLETLEHTAKIIALTKMLGGGQLLPPEQVAKLIQTRKDWGFARPGDDEDFCIACGVCHPQYQHRPRAAQAVWDDVAVSDEDQLVRAIAERVRRELQNSR